MLKIGHSITRPGRRVFDEPITINIPEELETVPGSMQEVKDVDYYSREYPLETQAVTETASREWVWTIYDKETIEDRRTHDRLNRPIVEAAKDTGDIEPTAEPVARDITSEVKQKARELGFGEVGITKFDMRYAYNIKKGWVKFPHAICLAYEQDYEPTQSAPSREAEGPHFGTYRIMGAVALDLADYIRSFGYYAQVHSPNDNSGAYIPMFVEAGLGQLGANGQLLSPHFGSRARIMVITTDAMLTYDEPVDYGINAFCEICQVCVNRCPGRALMREKVWWRGVYKHKLNYKRCRPVMSRYEGCAVCMKTCPIQRYGIKAVMDHYVETGTVLGKGTDLLEGYSLHGMGYFGPGELPRFDGEFFHIPFGKIEDNLFEELQDKMKSGSVSSESSGDENVNEFLDKLSQYVNRNPLDMMALPGDDQILDWKRDVSDNQE